MTAGPASLFPEPFRARLNAFDEGVQLLRCNGELDLCATAQLKDGL